MLQELLSMEIAPIGSTHYDALWTFFDVCKYSGCNQVAWLTTSRGKTAAGARALLISSAISLGAPSVSFSNALRGVCSSAVKGMGIRSGSCRCRSHAPCLRDPFGTSASICVVEGETSEFCRG